MARGTFIGRALGAPRRNLGDRGEHIAFKRTAPGQGVHECRENKHDPQTARGPRLGSGNDTISASFGGSGADFISIATAGGPASADPGPGRDKIRLNRNETKKIRNCETVYVFRDK